MRPRHLALVAEQASVLAAESAELRGSDGEYVQLEGDSAAQKTMLV